MKPEVTVLMPVFNPNEKHFYLALDSILNQTFKQFKLLLIDDASDTPVKELLKNYSDQRIEIIRNEKNLGITKSLNKGISKVETKYIARMDADDICHQERFEKQINYLKQKSNVDALFTFIRHIDDKGKQLGIWKEDKKFITYNQIKKYLFHKNCLAHPTLFIKTEVLKKLQYSEYQKSAQDYNLWLKLLKFNYRIEKIDEELLYYRVGNNSITDKAKNFLDPYRDVVLQFNFLKYEKFSLRFFEIKLFVSIIFNILFITIKYPIVFARKMRHK